MPEMPKKDLKAFFLDKQRQPEPNAAENPKVAGVVITPAEPLPSMTQIAEAVVNSRPILTGEQLATMATLQLKLNSLGVDGRFQNEVSKGPIVSIYRFEPTNATKVSQVEGLADDFAIALGVEDVFVKRMPGENAVGIFVPNKERRFIPWRETVQGLWDYYNKDGVAIPLDFGVDHLGNYVCDDLAKLPHLLIAGSTGSGKSTLLHCILAGIIYTCPKERVRLILSDTKGVEFRAFHGCSHLLYNVAESAEATIEQFEYAINELEKRLKLFGPAGFKNIAEYNAVHRNGSALPYILIVIDELADLLLNETKVPDYENLDKEGNPKDVKLSKIASRKLSYIVQKSRATGVHVIAGVQRPSVNVVTGDIKANFPARLSFRLPTEADSRTILGISGAEHLLSRGDMLYNSPNRPGIIRLHSPFAVTSDIEAAIQMAVMRERS